MDCINVDDDWRNRARSYSVRKFQDIGPAKVYWTYFAATEGIDVEVHYGFQSTETETTERVQENTLTFELGGQINFGEKGEGGNVNAKLTEQYRESVTESTMHSMTYSFDVTYSVGCTAKPGVEGVGLWQQVTEGTDGKFRVWGTQTICRYGDMWHT